MVLSPRNPALAVVWNRKARPRILAVSAAMHVAIDQLPTWAEQRAYAVLSLVVASNSEAGRVL